ncbi:MULTISPECIES: hypothetical protein [Nostoc]|uniref:Uncharacterized protein n=1 Tax=Nostoc punctiforme FACHB-252 TaxID=1357509 RepID=A0ABR8HK74_NOSPU|nr:MULTISPECIES: hypothetical protein [Nostoc]MBC1238635.1 hypothetical protein [Nostoc sp. 2RC]MBD2615629.1 hypothetical protein [Nostoc punctiforme FACHB-252]
MTYTTTTEQLRSVEIDFYEHELYAGQKLIARITYDHADFVTQRWVVMVNGEEVFRAVAQMKCYDYVKWHYKQGTLPVQQEEIPAAITGNEMMAQIALGCESLGYKLLDDGIYHNNVRLVEIVYRDGTPCFVQTLAHQPEAPSSSIDLLDKPFDELTADEWRLLLEYEPEQEFLAA